jgi:hypothetical protein
VIHLAGSGLYCLELVGSIPASSTGAAVTPYYPTDSTTTARFVHTEYNGHCGLKGAAVNTYLVTLGGVPPVVFSDQPFFAVIP